MTAVTYRIALGEPTLATTLDGDPNSAVSADFVPGTALRGAVIGLFLRRQGVGSLDPADPWHRRLFFDGTTRFLNAYPLDRAGHRSLPTPRCWYQAKESAATVYDLAVEPDQRIDQPRRVDDPFHRVDHDDNLTLIRPERRVTIHTRRRRSAGGPGRDEGDVYRYDALAPGQGFGAAIVCGDSDDAALLHHLLAAAGTIGLGGARSAGYGLAEIGEVRLEDDWAETENFGESERDGDQLILTLLSDALLRDAWGQPAADERTLTAALQTSLDVDLRLQDAFLDVQLVGGFNRTWGLPLPQAPAIAQGSVVVYRAPGAPGGDLQQRLRHLEATGLGERRAEGFGRVAVNQYDVERWKPLAEPAEADRRLVSLDPSGPAGLLAQRMTDRMGREQLDRGVVSLANNLTAQAAAAPATTRSQIARLRGVVRDVILLPPAVARSQLLAYLDHAAARSVSRQQLDRCSVGGQPLAAWVRAQLQDPSEVYDALLRATGSSRPPTVGSIATVGREELAFACTLRLIDAVLLRLSKSQVGAREGDDG